MVPLGRTLALPRLFVIFVISVISISILICSPVHVLGEKWSVWIAPRHLRSVPTIHLTSRLLIESTRGQKWLNIQTSTIARNPGLGNIEFLCKWAVGSRQMATTVPSYLFHVTKWTKIGWTSNTGTCCCFINFSAVLRRGMRRTHKVKHSANTKMFFCSVHSKSFQ